MKRTKIIATLGPATDNIKTIQSLMEAGVNVFRLNFSHDSAKRHEQRVAWIREASANLKREVAILADLQGPKIRIARFKSGSVDLKPGKAFVLDAELDDNKGNQKTVGIDYKQLPHEVTPGDILYLNDGHIELAVESIDVSKIYCQVVVGGILSDHKGINRKGGGLSAPAITDKDREDVQTATQLDVDYVALSFPRTAEDVLQARDLLLQAGSKAGLIAKIERSEAIEQLDQIIMAADGVMVARGDLGVEIGDAELPAVQKRIISRARSLNRFVATATQMMESMIENPIPTRAEVFDVANAVLDGTDAVMLSAETATGKHPEQVVKSMVRICIGAEKQRETQISSHRLDRKFERTDEAIAMASVYTANHTNVKAIVAFTESGATPLWMSRINTSIPIFGFTRHLSTQRKMTLFRDVFPIAFDITQHDPVALGEAGINELLKREIVSPGDLILITRGDILGVLGGTNRMKIVRVGDELGV